VMSDLSEMLDLIKRHREVAVLASFNFCTEDVAIVAGAYKGDTIAFLRGLYNMKVVGFEPQTWAFDYADDQFAQDHAVRVYPYGIGTKNGRVRMGEWGTDACSFVPDPAARTHGEGEMCDFAEVVGAIAWLRDGCDLAVFNMEGYEYELLPYMASFGYLAKVNHLVIQFHDMDLQEGRIYSDTQRLLERTHVRKWEHANWAHWTWQRWDAKS
jgi:FkbM family methyltransferase